MDLSENTFWVPRMLNEPINVIVVGIAVITNGSDKHLILYPHFNVHMYSQWPYIFLENE